ncbi:sulfatase family protein [Puniceicoccus vermicola]|uniref:Sulfatase-like hydrolase/transferase n=1 Tax=Puniceicoccus vermicola TaxID=388746 RepID=A0A7X1E3N7_9BACT|nr:sulfatase-like hydrolase/transferase [Puniceicoccus vermicola]MBC2601715.1 sulfatase-like hydrolase/transferase [Puniceicoccus vermicola]
MKPNVIVVLADQHHAQMMGCAGHPQALTPNLDAFADSGVRFSSAYAQNPICTPSRMSILSGQYCMNHGYYGLSGPSPKHLDNLFRHFKRNDYRTACYGKMHLPDSPRNWIADDVDEFCDAYERADGARGESEYLQHLESKGIRNLEDSWHNPHHYGESSISLDARPSDLPYEDTMEMWSLEKAKRFMKQSDSDPFFVELCFQKPHHPLLPQKRFWDLYSPDLDLPDNINANPGHRPPHFQDAYHEFHSMKWDYAKEGDPFEDGARRAWRGTLACISQIDDVFGKLLTFLEDNGLSENTIVIYGSDHGCYHGLHGIVEKAPGICSESVCKVPLIWKVPGTTPEGRICDSLVENIDIATTLPSLCNIPEMESADGCNIIPLLKGSQEPVREIAVTENPWTKALRYGKWRYVYYPKQVFGSSKIGELYDIESDPWETKNLYDDDVYSSVQLHCQRLLLDWVITRRRSVTAQVTIKEPQVSSYQRGAFFRYPVCEDGTAPNFAQPRNRSNLHQRYL